MTVLIAAALFIWFSPMTRGPTRAAANRIADQVQPLLGRLAAAVKLR